MENLKAKADSFNAILPEVRKAIKKQKELQNLQSSKSEKQKELVKVFNILANINGLYELLDPNVVPNNFFMELAQIEDYQKKLKVLSMAEIGAYDKQIDMLELEILSFKERQKSFSAFITDDGAFLESEDIQTEYLEEYIYFLMIYKVTFADVFTDDSFVGLLSEKFSTEQIKEIEEIINSKRGNLPLYQKFCK